MPVTVALFLIGRTVAKTKWDEFSSIQSSRSVSRSNIIDENYIPGGDHNVTSATQDWPTLQYKTAPTNSPWAETNKVIIDVSIRP